MPQHWIRSRDCRSHTFARTSDQVELHAGATLIWCESQSVRRLRAGAIRPSASLRCQEPARGRFSWRLRLLLAQLFTRE